MQPKASILIVDDVPANLQLLTQVLSANGYQLYVFTNGARALDMLSIHRPDLILLDLAMPDMDGFAVCERLKADTRTRDIPVVFLTAMDKMTDKVQAFRLGGVDYITKPFMAEEVLARVTVHVELHRLQLEMEAQVAARTAELQAEILRRQQQEAEKDRLFEVVRQQSDQLGTLMQEVLANQRRQQVNLVNALEREVARNLSLACSSLQAVSAALQDLPDLQKVTLVRLKDAQEILNDTLRQVAQVTRDMEPLPPEIVNNPLVTLTGREREILQLLTEGHDVPDIADWLHVTASTIYTHRQRIMHKLGADNLADLLKTAARLGMASPASLA